MIYNSTNKIENKNNSEFIYYNDTKEYMETLKSLDELNKIISDIGSNPYAFAMYKNHLDEYKKIFGEDFNEIHEIIKKLHKFTQCDTSTSEDINALYELIISFEQFPDLMEYLDDADKKYLAVIKKIHIEKDKEIFEEYGCMFYRLLYQFDKFGLTQENTIKEIQDKLVYMGDLPDIDSNEETEEDEDYESPNEDDEKYNDYKLGLIKLTDEEVEELEEKMLNKNSKIKECLRDENEEVEEEVTGGNNSVNMISMFQKYLKYKIKYLKMKKEIK